MRATIERDHARLVNHLRHDHGVAGRLHDAIAVAVDLRRHRTNDAERDAAIVKSEVGGAVQRTITVRPWWRSTLFRTRNERRCSPISRIDDERCLPEGSGEPRVVVAERADGILCTRASVGVALDLVGELLFRELT